MKRLDPLFMLCQQQLWSINLAGITFIAFNRHASDREHVVTPIVCQAVIDLLSSTGLRADKFMFELFKGAWRPVDEQAICSTLVLVRADGEMRRLGGNNVEERSN